ncbi:MAG TPA: PIN domain-containing protein [Candidatus Angelobacter sp.]|jgi:predicted nucleic acid-binding protein|nr:PIN domain-containing protein [Candidatus Angelobacter sp.]
MATSPSRVAWDSCTWIAHIQRERIFSPDGKTVIEDRAAMCRPVLDDAERGVIEIVVSAIALVEVLARNRASGIDEQRTRDFFDNDYILLVNVDKHLGDFARRLMLAGHAGLKPPDAIHLATACIANVDQFHTFDDRLLALDAVIDRLDGTRLPIKKPAVPAPPAPLLDEIERGRGIR